MFRIKHMTVLNKLNTLNNGQFTQNEFRMKKNNRNFACLEGEKERKTKTRSDVIRCHCACDLNIYKNLFTCFESN